MLRNAIYNWKVLGVALVVTGRGNALRSVQQFVGIVWKKKWPNNIKEFNEELLINGSVYKIIYFPRCVPLHDG